MTQADKTIKTFVVPLKTQACKCEFHSAEHRNMIRDRLVVRLRDPQLKRELLRDADLTLQTAENLCRAWEQSTKGKGAMSA